MEKAFVLPTRQHGSKNPLNTRCHVLFCFALFRFIVISHFRSFLQDGKEFGKRVTDVDAETDRMARLFLGVEDESQKKQRLRIVQVWNFEKEPCMIHARFCNRDCANL